MPAFVFKRQHDIELEAGFILAGYLVVDLPQEEELTEDQQQMLVAIIRHLTDGAQSGRMPADALVYGWHGGGGRPGNAVDTGNDEVMAAWARDCLRIAVRIDPRDDGRIRLDSDLIQQMEEADPLAPSGRRRQ
jgi:hypothetical protein